MGVCTCISGRGSFLHFSLLRAATTQRHTDRLLDDSPGASGLLHEPQPVLDPPRRPTVSRRAAMCLDQESLCGTSRSRRGSTIVGLPQCLRARESSIMQVYKTLLGSPRLRDLSFLLHLNCGLSVCAEVFPSTCTSGLIRSLCLSLFLVT